MNQTNKTIFSVPNSSELEQLTELHKAMGDYTRMKILWHLMKQEYCVSQLAKKIEVTESAISHQLHELRIARLVRSRKEGKRSFTVFKTNTFNGFWKKPMHIFLNGIHKTQRTVRCAHCPLCSNICNRSHYRFSYDTNWFIGIRISEWRSGSAASSSE